MPFPISTFGAKEFWNNANHGNASRILLDADTAEQFPAVLNFIYSPHGSMDVTRDNAVALWLLARTFQILPLEKKLARFVLGDMSVSNVCFYMTQASRFNDDGVLALATDTAAKHIDEMDADHGLWCTIDRETFTKIIRSPRLVHRRQEVSSHLSILVSEFTSSTQLPFAN